MVDFAELMQWLSVPRPNGSAAARATARRLQAWLAGHGIPSRVHEFRLYPYYFEAIGVWLIVSRTLLAAAVWGQWGWATLLIALIGLPGGLVDVLWRFPLVSWPGACRGENLLIEFDPPGGPAERELVLSAHYDSKTEPLDHERRMFFLRALPLGIVLTVLVGLLGPIELWLRGAGSPWAPAAYWTGAALSALLLFLAWGLGLNLTLGRFVRPSQGAVDNGAACAAMLGLAERLAREPGLLRRTRVTLALFAGEEVNMQGSRAYVRDRAWPVPAAAVNLEILAQDGDYVFWEQDGSVFKLTPTAPEVNALVTAAVTQATGQAPCPAGPVNSDCGSFLAAGIPATTLGTRDRRLGFGGLHGPADNLGRIVMARLPEAVEILAGLVALSRLAKPADEQRRGERPDGRGGEQGRV
jgi:hypothetical protein